MPHVLAVAALKGGTGKSTISTNLAAAFHAAGSRVLVVDADPQGTIRSWGEAAAANGTDVPPVVAMSGAQLRKDVPRVGASYELVIIDTPARLGAEGKGALMVADLVLLPVLPGGADVWALRQTLEVVEEARELHPFRAALVANRMDKRTALSAELSRALKSSGLPLLKTSLGQRVAYAEALTVGQGAVTYAPRSAAATEARALAREVAALLKKGRTP